MGRSELAKMFDEISENSKIPSYQKSGRLVHPTDTGWVPRRKLCTFRCESRALDKGEGRWTPWTLQPFGQRLTGAHTTRGRWRNIDRSLDRVRHQLVNIKLSLRVESLPLGHFHTAPAHPSFSDGHRRTGPSRPRVPRSSTDRRQWPVRVTKPSRGGGVVSRKSADMGNISRSYDQRRRFGQVRWNCFMTTDFLQGGWPRLGSIV